MKTMSRRQLLVIVLIATTYIVLYWRRLIVFGQVPVDGDTFRYVYPTWFIGKNMLSSGWFFLWDSYRCMGIPFLASLPNQPLYPFRIFSLFLNFVDYQRLFILFHISLIIVFSFLLVRQWTADLACAVFSCLGMAFNGFILARAIYSVDLATIAWLPAVLYFFETRKNIPLILVLSLQLLSGYPTFFLMTIALLLALSLLEGGIPLAITSIRNIFLTVCLCAIQLIPFLEMLKQSERGLFLKSKTAFEFSMMPLELLRQLFLPAGVLNHLPPLSSSDSSVIGFYISPFICLLLIGGIYRSTRETKIFAGIGFIAFALTLGQYLPLYRFIPFIKVFRFPAHWLFIAVACSILAAALILQRLNERLRWVFIAMVALDFLVYAWPAHAGWGDLTFVTAAPQQLHVIDPSHTRGRFFYASSITQNIHEWRIRSEQDWLFFLGLMPPSIGVPYGMRETISRHPLLGKRQLDYALRLDNSSLDSPLYNYAGIQKLVSFSKNYSGPGFPRPEDLVIYENKNFKDHAFMLNQNSVRIISEAPGHLQAEANGPGEFIYSESYYPGWKASVDGKESPIYIFEQMFPATHLDAGAHHIVFKYRPSSFYWGLAVTVTTAFFLVVSFFWNFSRRSIL